MGPQLVVGLLTPKRQNTVPGTCQRYHFVKKKGIMDSEYNIYTESGVPVPRSAWPWANNA